MPSFNIIRTSKPKGTFRTNAIIGKFDLQTDLIKEHFKGEIPIEKDWKVGLIVGRSGTGKTTIAKQLFPESYIEDFIYTDNAIIDDMPQSKSIDEITKTFNAVGFSSPPSWLKPYGVLSNGEKMRVDLANAILSDRQLFVFDEFTSVVDREVAKIGSMAMQKAIRKSDKKFIAVTCHFDVGEWLMPDWIFNTDNMTFQTFEVQKKNRPALEVKIYETQRKHEFWRTFHKYHYLSQTHNNAARVFVATVNDHLCGFISVIHFPHPRVRNMKRVHRLVILPDYQGIGMGGVILDEVARKITAVGNRFTITTSSPALIYSLKAKDKWKCTSYGRKPAHGGLTKISSASRITASFEFRP